MVYFVCFILLLNVYTYTHMPYIILHHALFVYTHMCKMCDLSVKIYITQTNWVTWEALWQVTTYEVLTLSLRMTSLICVYLITITANWLQRRHCECLNLIRPRNYINNSWPNVNRYNKNDCVFFFFRKFEEA